MASDPKDRTFSSVILALLAASLTSAADLSVASYFLSLVDTHIGLSLG
jgi:hypothetical protein